MATETLSINLTADSRAVIAAFNQVKRSAAELKDALLYYQDLAFSEKDVNKLRRYNQAINIIERDLKRAANVGKVGFDSVGDAIKKAVEKAKPVEALPVKLDEIGNAASKSEFRIGGLYENIRKLAYILPGIGIAGIFNLAFEAIGKAADELGIFAKKEDEAAKAAAEFNKEMLKQREGAEAEVSHLKALEDVASNSSISLKKRMQAVKELREQYPAYFKDLTDEQILTGNITAATDSLTQAIYKRAEARAREADIAKKATQVFENQQKIEELSKKIQDAGVRKSQAGPLQLQGGFGQGIPESVKIRVEENDLLKERDKLLTENSSLQLQIVSSQLKVNAVTAETINLDVKATKVIKDKYDALKEYFKLYYQRQGMKPGAFAYATDKTFADGTPETPKRLSNENNIFNQDIQDQSEKRAKDLEAYNEQLRAAKNLANAAADALQGLFNSMEKGLSFGEALGKMFEDLAKQIAIAAAKAAVFSIILNAVAPGSGAAAGGASKGGGFLDLFKGLLGFASGGTATGPTSGYPVLLHGTEHIVRPDQMNKIVGGAAQMGAAMGGGSQRIEVVGRIVGNDIWLSKQRTDYQRTLTT